MTAALVLLAKKESKGALQWCTGCRSMRGHRTTRCAVRSARRTACHRAVKGRAPRHGVSLLSGGSGRLDTRLDTPPSIKRRHPDSGIALDIAICQLRPLRTGQAAPLTAEGRGEVDRATPGPTALRCGSGFTWCEKQRRVTCTAIRFICISSDEALCIPIPIRGGHS
jgi:hypothetical protein